MLLSRLKTCHTVQLKKIKDLFYFSLFFSCLLSARSLCSGSHKQKDKAATILNVTTSLPSFTPCLSPGRSHPQSRRSEQRLFHWQFKLTGGVNVGGSNTGICFFLLTLQVDSNFQQNCKMDSCEHEYLKSWQLHLAQLVCQRPMTERLVGSVVSADRGLLERGTGKLRPKNPVQTTASSQRIKKPKLAVHRTKHCCSKVLFQRF